MHDLFRIETDRATVRWTSLSEDPPTTGHSETPRVLVTADAAEVIYPQGAPARLFEQSDYRLMVRARTQGSRVELRHRDPNLLRGVLPAEDSAPDLVVGTLNFRNQVGRSRFEVRVDGRRELTFEVEVFPAKLDYREDYDQILAEVQNILTALAFEYLRATHTGAQDRPGPPTALEWALRLRSIVDDLERGLQHVARHPIRSLRRERRTVRAERIRRPDATVLRAARVGGGSGPWIPLNGGAQVRSRLPTRRAEPTLDTPEHRWLADHLTRAHRRLTLLVVEESSRRNVGTRAAAAIGELRAMESRLHRLLRLEPLAAVTQPAPTGFTSLKLLGAPGYREAAAALIALQLGLRLEGNALDLSLKDISTLYEYWCFLAVIDLVSQRTGHRIDPHELVQVQATGLRVLLRKGREMEVRFPLPGGRTIRVQYNPTYNRYVLLNQQPDIMLVLETPNEPTLRVVLDAKYRVDASPTNRNNLGVLAPPADALNVLHRYRDAILTSEPSPQEGRRLSRSVVYAASLYPASIDNETFRRSRLSWQLRTVGVGAVPFLPSSRSLLETWLNELLHLDGWSLGQGAQPAAYEPWVWRAASEVVLVGVLRKAKKSAAKQHLDWCLEGNRYYLPERETRHGRQSMVSHVALYLPVSLSDDGVGAVSLIGRVVESRVLPRAEVDTPWGSRGHSAVRVYRVESWEHLKRPVPNPDGQRVSTPRWSNRLAVERATSIAELALESPLEWALADALRSAAVPFTILAGKVDALANGRPRGRARFCIGDSTEVRYAGANGFELRRSGEPSRFRATVPQLIESLQSGRARG